MPVSFVPAVVVLTRAPGEDTGESLNTTWAGLDAVFSSNMQALQTEPHPQHLQAR